MSAGEPLVEGHLLDGRYRVKKVLGVGGMGRVYLANDTRLANRPVAAKEMVIGEGIAEKKAIEDFTREATVLARLSHPGIPTLIDHFAERGRHYLVMEFVSGGDLEHVLSQAGPGGKIPEEMVVRWARQILSVLEFLHAQNPQIIYRDLKPGNIMIDKDGRAMLIDFGIARFLPKSGRATQIGSPGYAPPEQYTGRVEARSDLYSLAATMHHLLTGRDPRLEPPFTFPQVRQLAPEVSAATASAVDRALSHAPDKRFTSAREMLNALPDIGPATVATGSGAFAASSGDSLGSIPTAVLAGAAPLAVRDGKSSVPTPGRIPSTPRLGAQPSAAAQAPTVVLNTGAPAKPAPTPSRVSPSIKKAIELTGKARAIIERGMKSKLVESVLPALHDAPSVSSTAKTQDLKLSKPARAASLPLRPVPVRPAANSSTSKSTPRTPPLFADRNGAAQVSPATARLIARAENQEFPLASPRIVIGRSEDGTDELDIDLRSLKRGAERVSRKHAEIIRRGAEYFLRDLGSLNGTFVAGRGRLGRDQLYKLKDRDQVVLGGAILQFRRST